MSLGKKKNWGRKRIEKGEEKDTLDVEALAAAFTAVFGDQREHELEERCQT
jgi:hypothetical protein